jgi:hypothetical protein
MKTFSIDLFLTETKFITKEFKAKTEEEARDMVYEYQHGDTFVKDIDDHGKSIDLESFNDHFKEVISHD